MPTSSVCAAVMTQLYLCEEPYWSKYDRSEICPHALQINVISDGKKDKQSRGASRDKKLQNCFVTGLLLSQQKTSR